MEIEWVEIGNQNKKGLFSFKLVVAQRAESLFRLEMGWALILEERKQQHSSNRCDGLHGGCFVAQMFRDTRDYSPSTCLTT